jgi:hypothetical protein
MSPLSARDTPVFSAGGYPYTWVEVIEAAQVRGQWAALRRHVAGLLTREGDPSCAATLPTPDQTKAAANEFRHGLKLLSADELHEWLARHDIGVGEWMAEMRRSLLEPADTGAQPALDVVEQASWVHAVCSGKLAAYAQTLAEEVAVALAEEPNASPRDDLAALADKRERFCAAQPCESALVAEVRNNKIGWTRVDLELLSHPDLMVVREAALCVDLDGREMSDVAADAGARLQDLSLMLDDVEPSLRIRLLAADAGELVGPFATATDHLLGRVLRRVPPGLDDPAVRHRAEETVIGRALAAEVNRHVHWHEHL